MNILMTAGERCYFQPALQADHSSHLFSGDTLIGTDVGFVNRERERETVKYYGQVYWLQTYNKQPELLVKSLIPLFETANIDNLIFHNSMTAQDIIAVLKGVKEECTPGKIPLHYNVDLTDCSDGVINHVMVEVGKSKLMDDVEGVVKVRYDWR